MVRRALARHMPQPADAPLPALRVRRAPYKRPLDWAILVASHIVLSPFLLLAWAVIPALILLEDGRPVLFKQERVGKGGRHITVHKFRTMKKGAEASGLWTSAEDPRVTRVGRVLRKLALDEIPQLISIWRGDMSFVGPRPLAAAQYEGYVQEEPRFPLRQSVLPGLTGPAAIRLPRHCSASERLRWDLYYAEHASLPYDVWLVVLSAWLTLTGQWGKGVRSAPDATQPHTDWGGRIS